MRVTREYEVTASSEALEGGGPPRSRLKLWFGQPLRWVVHQSHGHSVRLTWRLLRDLTSVLYVPEIRQSDPQVTSVAVIP
jgi:hypothetical protein